MSDITTLSVFKKSKAILSHTMICTKGFNASYRDTIGRTMVDHAINCFILICEANPLDVSGKIRKLEKAERAIRTLDGFYHAAFDIRALEGLKKKSEATQLCAELLGDVTKWKRYNQRLQRQDGGNYLRATARS